MQNQQLLKVKFKLIFILLLLCSVNVACSQKKAISIRFNPVYDSLQLEPGKKYPYKNDSVEISVLKFYISGIKFYSNDELAGETEKKHHLIDLENAPSLYILHTDEKHKEFNRIQFSIGVDSLTSESGVFGGDLDPVNGMYWTWQSGYINFKLEGKSKLCPSRKNQFTFHIGGYQYPYNSIQNLNFTITNIDKIVININIAQLLSQLKLTELYEVMSPNEKAVEMARKIAAAFSVAK
ncbi:MAG: MbnP family protein [Bacteroidota bacterium]